jgi:copper chaperone CopZ
MSAIRTMCPCATRFEGHREENPTVTSQSFRIPTMTSRRCVRTISARISDVPGVRTVEAFLAARTVRVTGTADPAAVRTAIRTAGHEITAAPDAPDPDGTDRHAQEET